MFNAPGLSATEVANLKPPDQRQPGLRPTKTDLQLRNNLTDANSVVNPFDTRLRDRKWNPQEVSGLGATRVGTYSVYNPNITDSMTGMTTSPVWWNPWTYKKVEGQLDLGKNLTKDRQTYINMLNGLDPKGYEIAMNGHSHQIRPETVEFYKSLSPYWTVDLSQGEEAASNAIRNQVGSNIQKLYEQQGTWQALNGFKKYNTILQEDLNADYQHAMALINSGDENLRKEGEMKMAYVTRAQHALNTALPQVTEQTQARIKPYRDFMKNNWWWMIPGGLLALGGIASLFGGRDEEQQTPEQAGWPFAQNAPQQPKQPLPEGWTSPLVPRLPVANTGMV